MNLNEINSKEIGERLAFVLAKKPEYEQQIFDLVQISKFTLNRYKAGKSKKMPFIELCKICIICKIDIYWLTTGKKENTEEQLDLFTGEKNENN